MGLFRNFLFTNWEGGGNVAPMVEVVRKVVARGHKARVIAEECNRAEYERAGATFSSWKTAPNRKDRTPETQEFHDWAAKDPGEGLAICIRDAWAGPALKYAKDVIEELEREPADLVITCEVLFGVLAACEKLGQPVVLLCPNISLTPQPGIPPLGPGFAPAKNDEERAMHAQVAAMSVGLFDFGLPYLNAARAELGLAPLEHLLDQLEVAETQLLATAQAFDFPSSDLPEHVKYVGPQMADPTWAKAWKNPWPASDKRPLVTVSFSTTFQNHAACLQNVIDALSTLPVRVLVTLGGSIKREALKPAVNCVLSEGAPHSVVMKEATVVIAHGGHGTTMSGLMARKPMLIIPHGRDQNDNAVRVTERGAGLCLMPPSTATEIRAAVGRLLSDPSFAAAAKKLGDACAAESERTRVVEILEEVAAGELIGVG